MLLIIGLFVLLAVVMPCLVADSCKNFILDNISEHTDEFITKIIDFIPKFIVIALILIFGILLISIINRGFRRYSEMFERDLKYSAVFKIVKFTIWALIIFASLSVIVGNVGVFLTSLGLVGFGITFALQKPILNLVGWFTLIFNRAYTVGDRIQVGSVRGDVVEIELMYTKLDGILENTDELSGKRVTIPNEMILTTPVTNFTKSGAYIWDELEITITYESNWQKAIKTLEEVAVNVVNKYIQPVEKHKQKEKKIATFKMLNVRHVDQKDEDMLKMDKAKEKHDQEMIDEHMENKPIVRVMFKDSAIALNVRYLAYYRKLMAIKSDINNRFLNEIERSDDIEIAYPHMQIVTEGKTKR
jgi:small-conductance mechanosensitive channel